MAPAAAEVTVDGGSAATTRVDSPASASEMAVVKPTTPAPTTTMSTAAMNSTVQDPLVADEDAGPDTHRRPSGEVRRGRLLRVPASPVGSRPDQGDGVEKRVVVGRPAVAGIGPGGGVDRVVVADGDRGLRARLGPGIDVEDRDAVTGRAVTPRGPGGAACAACAPCVAALAAAAAEHQVDGALAGIEDPAVDGGDRVRAQRAGRVEAADGKRALVPPAVPAQHQVRLVAVEQR